MPEVEPQNTQTRAMCGQDSSCALSSDWRGGRYHDRDDKRPPDVVHRRRVSGRCRPGDRGAAARSGARANGFRRRLGDHRHEAVAPSQFSWRLPGSHRHGGGARAPARNWPTSSSSWTCRRACRRRPGAPPSGRSTRCSLPRGRGHHGRLDGGLPQRRCRSSTTCSRCRARPPSTSAAIPRGESKGRRFDQPGVVKVFCHLHSHMTALVRVFDHPYFARLDADGPVRDRQTCRRAATGWWRGTNASAKWRTRPRSPTAAPSR